MSLPDFSTPTGPFAVPDPVRAVPAFDERPPAQANSAPPFDSQPVDHGLVVEEIPAEPVKRSRERTPKEPRKPFITIKSKADETPKPVKGPKAPKSSVGDAVGKRQKKPIVTVKRKETTVAQAGVGDAGLPEKKPLITVVGKKARPDEIGETLEDLAAMLEAGESEEHALGTLSKQYAKMNVGAAYGRAAEKMRNHGATVIEALASETDVFPRVARELIGAASTPRDLHANLRHAALIIVENSDIRAQIRSALFKPMLTLGIVIAFILVAAQWLLPGVATMFTSIGAPVPPLTVAMIGFGSSLKWVIGGIVVLYLLFLGYWVAIGRKDPKLRIARDKWAIRAPMVGPIQQMATAARFADVLAACLSSGMTELEALEVAGRACGNEAVNAHVLEHIVKQQMGLAVFADVAATPLFPWNLENRIEVAPSPRQRIQVMRDLAKVFHKKSHRRLEAFADRVGPVTEIFVLSAAAVVILMIAIPVTTFAPALLKMTGN